MSRYLQIDKETFSSRYPGLPFVVRHSLADHPLFAISRLLELQKALPQGKIDYYTGRVGVNDNKRQAPPTGLTAEETIRQIKSAESWLVLKNIERDPEYRKLVEDCLAEVAPLAEPVSPGVKQFEGWIFLTSPGSLTPYHLDPEHNLLLQIRGEKTVHLFDPADRDILSEEELENYYTRSGTVGKLEFNHAYQEKAYTYTITPGDGVFIPVNAPHWLQVTGDVSISLSITFYSDDVYRRARLFRFNHILRRWGLRPSPYGKSAGRDRLKDSVITTYLKARSLLGRPIIPR